MCQGTENSSSGNCAEKKRIAKVAMARKLAVRLYWMWRDGWQYSQLVEFGSNARKLGIVHGVK
jgi:transposase